MNRKRTLASVLEKAKRTSHQSTLNKVPKMDNIIRIELEGYTEKDGSIPCINLPKLPSRNLELELNRIEVQVPSFMLRSGSRFHDFKTIWRLKCNMVKARCMKIQFSSNGEKAILYPFLAKSQDRPQFEQMELRSYPMTSLNISFKSPNENLVVYEPEIKPRFPLDPKISEGGRLEFQVKDEKYHGGLEGFLIKIEASIIIE